MSLSLPSCHKTPIFCESYALGKSTKLPFLPCSTHAINVLYQIHMDVWGPALVTSYDNFLFYLVIINEYSRFVWLFPLAQKSDLAYSLQNFITLMHNQFPNHVKEIQTDGGCEFVN